MRKNILLLYCLINTIFLFGQTFDIKYEYTVNNKFLGKSYVFPADLKFDKTTQTKFYKVQFGIETNKDLPDNAFTSKKKPLYYIYAKPKMPILIFENVANIKELDYVFSDDYDMKWILIPESKVVNNIKLLKAELIFRGRHYIAWYDSNAKISVGPWKFKNLEGLIYEVSDDENNFRWNLVKYGESKEDIKNPFDSYSGEILSFHQYPQLRYGLTAELKKELEKVPNNRFVEQERNGLERKFEWEQDQLK